MKRRRWLHIVFFSCAGIVALYAQDSDTTQAHDSSLTSGSHKKLQAAYPFSSYSLTQEKLRSFPFRGLQNYLSVIPGVVFQNGNLHFRGGRAGEVGYFIDGFSVTNPFFNSNGVEIIPEAVEQIDVVTGAYGAELGGANAGLVLTRMKSGTDSLQFSVDVQTDNVVRTGSEFLSTTSYGYRNFVGTLGGPLIPGVKFFLAGQHHYLGNRQPMFLEPFRYDSLVQDQLGTRPQGTALPGPVAFSRNSLDNNWRSATTIQGNAIVGLGDMSLRFVGSYSSEEWLDGGEWPAALRNVFREKRNMRNETRTWFGGLTFSHRLSEDLTYDFDISFYDRFARRFDLDFGDEWQLYSDSLANAQKGYTGFFSRYNGPLLYSTIFAFYFDDPNAPNNRYNKDRQDSWSLNGNVTYRVADTWHLKAGVERQSWTIRKFDVSSSAFMSSLYGYDGLHPVTFNSEYEKRVLLVKYGFFDLYGYTYLGDEVNNGYDSPRRPRFFSYYFDSKIRDSHVQIDFGARYEVFDLRLPVPKQASVSGYDYYINNLSSLSIVDEDKYENGPSTKLFLPRLSICYEASPSFSAYASFGKYAQMTDLNSLLLANVRLDSRINPINRLPYWFGGPLVGFFAEPELSYHYEFGMQHQLSDLIGVSLRAYYKSLTRQLQLGRVYDQDNKPLFVALLNNGAGLTKGIEITLSLMSKQVSALLTYVLSDARGKSSHSTWNRFEVTDEQLPPIPQRLFPFDYDQTHRGSLLLDLHFSEEDGTILNGLGISAIALFNSGHRYTRLQEIRFLGAANPWNIGVRQILDPRSALPLEEWNASSTPWVFNIDLAIRKRVPLGFLNLELFVHTLNLLNNKNVMNVYPTTGTPTDDSWLSSPFAQNYTSIPRYEEFYRTINLQNRWAYMGATGNDIYGPPRQIRFGVRVDM